MSRRSNAKKVRVRMYNVGFGDAFLVSYTHETVGRHILIDCGSIAKSENDMDTVVGYILEDCMDEKTGQMRIDVVVATHRHCDHVSGFADKRWNDVDVGEVWMPWTEHPTDPEAKRIRSKQLKLAGALEEGFRLRPLGRLRMFEKAILNALPNASAMDTLHRGFAGSPKRRFLPTEDKYLNPITSHALPNAKIHVLGPSREESVIRDMDPPPGESFTVRMNVSTAASLNLNTTSPFGSEYVMSEAEYAHYNSSLSLTPDQLKAIDELNQDEDPLLAATLDKAINGTSLVLVLEIGEACLLFPGDAQWGTWECLMDNPVAVELLRRTSLYKVGHHGSHNATPKRFVDEYLPTNTASLVSTREMSNWPRIPVASLIDDLGLHKRCVVRSDDTGRINKRFKANARRHVDIELGM